MGYSLIGAHVAEILLLALAGSGPPATLADEVLAEGLPAQAAPFRHSDNCPVSAKSVEAAWAPPRATPAAFVDLSPGASPVDGAIRRAADGLFYVNATVNGVPVRFLVDTGASMVVLTPSDAERIGVMPPPESFQHEASTAGGRTVMARVTLARIAAGPTERQAVDAAIAGAGLDVSLLGQSWLSQLQSMTIAGDRMVLR